MIYRGHVKAGAIVLDQPAELPEGAAVRIELLKPSGDETEPSAPTLYERLKPIIGAADDLPPDASVNLDHYLYGHAKR